MPGIQNNWCRPKLHTTKLKIEHNYDYLLDKQTRLVYLIQFISSTHQHINNDKVHIMNRKSNGLKNAYPIHVSDGFPPKKFGWGVGGWVR